MDYPSNPDIRLHPSTGKFTDGVPASGILASRDSAEVYNQIWDELLNLIGAAGLTPNEHDLTQIRQAVGALISNGLATYTKFEPDIAAMKADATLKIGMHVHTIEAVVGRGAAGGNDWLIGEGGSFGVADGWSVVDLDSGLQAKALFPGTVNVKQFGAKSGDSSFDNRIPFQASINAACALKKTWEIPPTLDTEKYHIKSFEPSIEDGGTCLYIDDVRNFKAIGHRRRNANVIYSGSEPGFSLLRLLNGASDWGVKLEDLGLDANNLLDHCLEGADNWYANSELNGGSYENAVLDAVHLSLYMSTVQRVHTVNAGRDGLAFGGPESVGGWTTSTCTSLNVQNCWTRFAGRYGISVANELWYSDWSNNGVDGSGDTGGGSRPEAAYYIKDARGMTFASNGAEEVDRYLITSNFRGFDISGVQTRAVGPTTGKARAFIELLSGYTATIKSVAFGAYDSLRFDHLIYCAPTSGRERIDILDGSVDASTVFAETFDGYQLYPGVFRWSVGDGFGASRGYGVSGNYLFPGAGVAGSTDGYVKKDVKFSNASFTTGTTHTVPLVEMEGSSGGAAITLGICIAKFAGSTPVSGHASASFMATATWRNGVGEVETAVRTAGDSALTASIAWSGSVLELTHNGQFSVSKTEIEVATIESASVRFV